MAAIPFKVERLIGKNFNAVKCSTLATWRLYNGRVKVKTTFLKKIKVQTKFFREKKVKVKTTFLKKMKVETTF